MISDAKTSRCGSKILMWPLQWRDGVSDHWHLRLFAEPFVQAHIKESIKVSRHWLSIWWRYHTITCSSCCRSLPNCIWHSINLTATKWHRNVFAILVTIYLKPISLAKILTRTNEQESSLNVHEGRHFFNWPEKNPIRFVVSRVPTRRSDA